ncbi:TRAP transporter small permease [Aureimonas populi]|uniref:TRAP transporter small permease protein n=1 Tax=Aureimonas populi TaxID=1701758 RepID=A0ABW5CPM0_9HYPH|nr:TRAP transporter small permease [Aureimonas populi]
MSEPRVLETQGARAAPSSAAVAVTGACDFLAGVGAVLGALCMAAMFLLIFGEVLSRAFLGRSIHFSWEYAGYSIGAVVFLASATALRRGVHVRLTLLIDNLPRRLRAVGEAVATLIALAIMLVVTSALFTMVSTAWVSGAASPTYMRTPLYIPQGLMLLGLVMLDLQLVGRLFLILLGQPTETKVSTLMADH